MIVFGGLKNINAHCLPKKTALMGGPINSSAWKAKDEIFEYIFVAWESKINSLLLFEIQLKMALTDTGTA